MKRSTALLAFCTTAGPALAHAPGSEMSLADAARHLLLGGHHLAATLLAVVVLAGAVRALDRRRRTEPARRSDRKR